MGSFTKWLGAGLGFSLGGPIGAAIGFAIGQFVSGFSNEDLNKEQQAYQRRPKTGSRFEQTQSGDFEICLLVLASIVIKADGKVDQRELDFVRNQFVNMYGKQRANNAFKLFNGIIKKEVSARQVCIQIRQNMPHASRLQLVHFLFGIAKSDQYVVQAELEEIKKISDIAHKHNLNMHMDGARFANALVSLDATPAEMTWKSGIDVLSFGATKNGCLAAEAIIFFKKDLVGNIAFLMKRAGHLLSKMRFVSAQLDAYISDDVWLRNARHANKMGKKLSEGLNNHSDIKLAYPTEANEVFAKFPRNMIEHLNSEGYKMNEDELDGKAVRLVAAWNTKDSDVDQLLETLKNSN